MSKLVYRVDPEFPENETRCTKASTATWSLYAAVYDEEQTEFWYAHCTDSDNCTGARIIWQDAE